ncbi:UNVERIFIED_CONTAM: hypothetical protein PYX00_009393 [Menopon gallinae]|uniref:Centriolar and ciliogenesis-associated protein HYLS1 C-terminal domain-containing protein n=1 Tax=Menopon gallinae TaxID=328185 RepID=A0AAW2HB72_9NEOP
MIDPESLNPVEVLTHLRQLGYDNITNAQLDEFMHDLKKLIRYEQRGNNSVCSSTDEENYSCSHDGNSSNDQSGSTNSSDLCSNCNLTKSDSGSDVSEVSSLNDFAHKRKRLEEGRPHSSFIRPWQLQPQISVVCKPTKCDPVQLYHKYKEMWSLQKVPGEKTHSQLRWVIREKMLGQDPHPRPISQSSDRRSCLTSRRQ